MQQTGSTQAAGKALKEGKDELQMEEPPACLPGVSAKTEKRHS